MSFAGGFRPSFGWNSDKAEAEAPGFHTTPLL